MRDKRLKEETLSSKLREHVETADATAALENVEATKAAMPRQVKCSQVDTASSRRATQRARHPLSRTCLPTDSPLTAAGPLPRAVQRDAREAAPDAPLAVRAGAAEGRSGRLKVSEGVEMSRGARRRCSDRSSCVK